MREALRHISEGAAAYDLFCSVLALFFWASLLVRVFELWFDLVESKDQVGRIGGFFSVVFNPGSGTHLPTHSLLPLCATTAYRLPPHSRGEVGGGSHG